MKMIGKVICRLLTCTVFALALAACRHDSNEARVKAAIAAVAQAAEAGSASDLGEPISEDFAGNDGELDRRSLTSMVRLLALRGEPVGVTMGPVSIEQRGERMVATFTVTLTSGGKFLPDQMGIYQVESAWRQEDGEWRCYTATWKRSL
ncbi:MAG: hypothetical protein ABI343_04390 [Burkholderiaceae bacterium]